MTQQAQQTLVYVVLIVAGLIVPIWLGVRLWRGEKKGWAIATLVTVPLGSGLVVTFGAVFLIVLVVGVGLTIAPFLLLLKVLGVPIGWPDKVNNAWVPDWALPAVGSGWKKCSNCGKRVSAAAQQGETCPHCGATWAFETPVKK